MKRIVMIIFSFILTYAISSLFDINNVYSKNIKNTPCAKETIFKVGIAKMSITPKIDYKWIDSNGNNLFDPENGDSLVNKNGHKELEPFWLAGFYNGRAAIGIHDDLWARVIVCDDGNNKVAFVVLDVCHFMYDDVLAIREIVKEKEWEINHIIIAATHTHSAPDFVGIAGPSLKESSVNKKYLEYVKKQIVEAIGEANRNLVPTIIKIAKADSMAKDLIHDVRPPYVIDDTMYLIQFVKAETNVPFGILVNWANHPHCLGINNNFISSDFCHYLREGVETGIVYDDKIQETGIGGTVIFANGAVGGHIVTLPKIFDPWLKKDIEKNIEKTRTLGYRLADLILKQIKKGKWETLENPTIEFAKRTFLLEIQNEQFKKISSSGIVNRSIIESKYIQSEVNLVSIGSLKLISVPGEINPEIVNGGIEYPEGADFPIEPIETPPIRRLLNNKYILIIGLANDNIGYIMPKTHWDINAPYAFGREKPFHEESASIGADVGPVIYKEIEKLIKSK